MATAATGDSVEALARSTRDLARVGAGAAAVVLAVRADVLIAGAVVGDSVGPEFVGRGARVVPDIALLGVALTVAILVHLDDGCLGGGDGGDIHEDRGLHIDGIQSLKGISLQYWIWGREAYLEWI